MNRQLSVLLGLVGILATGLVFFQWRNARRSHHQVTQLQQQLRGAEEAEKAAAAKAKEMEREKQRLQGEVLLLERDVYAARAASAAALQLTNSTSPNQTSAKRRAEAATPQNMMQQMFNDPEMRKMMEAQQRMAIDMMYGQLFKELGLTPEETDEFKSLLFEQQTNSMMKAMAMLEGKKEGSASTTATGAAQDHEQSQAQLKAFLGDERFAKFQEYQGTLGERMMLSQFSSQAGLSPEQSAQMLEVMKQEKAAAKETRPDLAMSNQGEDIQKLIQSDTFLEEHLRLQEAINARVFDRARNILEPEKLDAFQKFQTNQLAMQRIGMTMARKMQSAPGQENNPPPPPPPQPVPER